MSKTASGQVGPKNEKNRPPGKRVKRGRLNFTEEEVTRQVGAHLWPSWPEASKRREIPAGRGTGKAFLPPAFRGQADRG